MKKTLIVLFLGAVILCLPLSFNVADTFPRLDSDYDAQMNIFTYVGGYIRVHHAIPQEIPFIGTGIPVVGNPLDATFNPIFSLPFIFFNGNMAIRIVILLNAFFSGLSMFVFLRSIKLPKPLSYCGAFLYMSSGGFISAVAAGHVTEKFLVFPLTPLLFALLLQKKLSFKKIFGLGCILGATIYCGDFYALWFFSLFILIVRGFYFFKEREKMVQAVSCIAVFVVAAIVMTPKIYFFTRDVLPILKRTNIVNPFLGSIHFFLFPLQFLMPLQVNFYDRPFFQRGLGFYYNWYEYYAFIGLLPVLFLTNIKKVFRQDIVRISLLLLLVGSFYVANAYWYSPFHYLFLFIHPFDMFRVPQRIGTPLSVIAILLFLLCANTWKNKKTLYGILGLSLLWTYGIFWVTLSYTFVPIPKDSKAFAVHVAKIDTTHSPVLNIEGASEYLLTQNNIPISNYYYGWVPKATFDLPIKNGKLDAKAIMASNIQYILSSKNYSFETLGYQLIFTYKDKMIWKKKGSID